MPGLQSNAVGTTWSGKTPAGKSLPIDQFYIVKPGATAADINSALAAGKNLLVTPGVYHLNQTDSTRSRAPTRWCWAWAWPPSCRTAGSPPSPPPTWTVSSWRAC